MKAETRREIERWNCQENCGNYIDMDKCADRWENVCESWKGLKSLLDKVEAEHKEDLNTNQEVEK